MTISLSLLGMLTRSSSSSSSSSRACGVRCLLLLLLSLLLLYIRVLLIILLLLSYVVSLVVLSCFLCGCVFLVRVFWSRGVQNLKLLAWGHSPGRVRGVLLGLSLSAGLYI